MSHVNHGDPSWQMSWGNSIVMQTQSTLSGISVAQPARGLDYVVCTNRPARK